MEIASAVDEDQNGQIIRSEVRPYTEPYVFDKLRKKPRVDDGEDIRRVAEVVMVLSATSKIRSGRSPSTAEMLLMAEAREKLVDMCGFLAPKDILGRDAVRVVLEDLGLNRLKDQRLGFRPPKVSIAEKLTLTKRKMEESRETIVQTPSGSPHVLPVGIATNTNVDGYNTTFHHGGTQSKMQPQPAVIVMSQPSSSSLANDPHSFPLPQTEAAHFILDPQSNGPSYMLQVRASSSGVNMEVKSETSSQVPSSALAKTCESFKTLDHSPLLSKGVQEPNNFQVASQPAGEHNPNAFAVQSASIQGLTFGLPAQSSYTNHIDIARTVQKILQSRVPDHHKWVPPLIDYMNKPLMCQVCKLSISDIETLLVCDSCEKGTHLKCLHTFNQRSIPKGEWHCPKCLIISNGRPLPPKYGRVSRNVGVPKASICSTDKKIECTDQNDDNQQKDLAFGNSSSLNPVPATNMFKNPVEIILEVPTVRGERVICPNKVKDIDEDHKISRNQVNNRDGEVSVSAVALDGSQEQLELDDKLSSCDAEILVYATVSKKAQSGDVCGNSSEISVSHGDRSETFFNSQEGPKIEMETGATVTKKQSVEATANEYEELKESKKLTDIGKCVEANPKCESVSQDGGHVFRDVKLDVVDGTYECNKSLSEALHEEEWIGNPLRVVDEKTYYDSCCINGIIYKMKDYVLLGSNSHELYPSKIQIFWEDNKTRRKWVGLSKCYFPGDIPESVGRPSAPEKDEVYDSNHEITALVGLVRGPCQVLSQNKFLGECEKRRLESSCGLQPVFLCKWFYDDLKDLFRPVIN